MPTAASFTPPKKKPSVFWWIGGVLIAIIGAFSFQLFGPNPKLIVSPKTTYITSPLDADGLPDYKAHLLQRLRHDVTSENNAAALLWPALWPTGLQPSECAAVAAELGLPAIPSTADAAVPISEAVRNQFESTPKRRGDQTPSQPAVFPNTKEEFENWVTSHAWTTDELPWLAQWARDNQKPLDALVEASRRPKCYFPSPSLLHPDDELLLATLLPGVQAVVPQIGRTLAARAMWHAGEHRTAAAWQDTLAIYRIDRLVASGPMLMDQAVGAFLDEIASRNTVVVLTEGQMAAPVARQILRNLMALPQISGFANSLDKDERILFLDSALQLRRGDPDLNLSLRDIGPTGGNPFPLFRRVRLDWNFILSRGNDLYDRYASAARLPRYESRRQAVQQLDQSVEDSMNRGGIHTFASSTLNLTYRSDTVALFLLSRFTPSIDAVLIRQDRANAMLDLTRLAAALAVYRAEKGKYPERLDDLVPGILEKLPLDLYHAKPFFYKRIDTGYVLYTAGPNGQDDGGSNSIQNIFMGYRLEDFGQAEADAAAKKISAGADDLSIRVPLPPLKPRPAEFNPSQSEAR